MKKITLLSIALIFTTTTFYSCKKNQSETTAEKLQHTWTLVTNINDDTPNGDFHTTYGTPQDIVTFEKNGTVISHLYGSSDTSSYSIIDANKKIVFLELQDTETIQTLTDVQLVLYSKSVVESTTTFKR